MLEDITYLWRRPRRLAKSLLVMYVLVPLAAFPRIADKIGGPLLKWASLALGVCAIVLHESKSSQGNDEPFYSHPHGETLDVFEFIARVLTQLPEPRAHGVRYFGVYSSRARTGGGAAGMSAGRARL